MAICLSELRLRRADFTRHVRVLICLEESGSSSAREQSQISSTRVSRPFSQSKIVRFPVDERGHVAIINIQRQWRDC